MKSQRGRPPDPERRQAVLDAVVDHLLANGLAGLSLRPLASAVGGTPKLLLHHFGSKEQLVIEAIREVDRRRRRFYDQMLDDGIAPQDVVLLGWGLATSEQGLALERFRLHALALALEDPDSYGEFLQSFNDDSLELFERGLEIDGVVDSDERRRVATVVRAVLRGLHMDLMASGDATRVEAAAFHYFAEQLREWMDSQKRAGRMRAPRRQAKTAQN